MIVLSFAAKSDRFINPIVDALAKSDRRTEANRDMAAAQMKAVLTMAMVLGAVITVAGVVLLFNT
jgi:hypothetical protein